MASLVLVTRPIEQAAEFAEQIRAAGLTPLIQPLLTISPRDVVLTDADMPAAIILSSRQSLKNVHIPSVWQDMSVFCVGAMTEKTARQAGLTNIITGHGNLADLFPLIRARIPAGRTLLYLRGENVTYDLHRELADYQIHEVTTYCATPVAHFDPEVLEDFAQIDVITLFSVRSAAVLRHLIHENGLISYVKNINLLCLSASVVESMVEMNWKSCMMPDLPTQFSMLEKLKSM